MAAVVRAEDQALLVTRGSSSAGGDFVRPLGDSAECGESALEAVRREIREELGAELASVRLLGVLESRFELDGIRGREVVFAFGADLSDPSLHGVEVLHLLDAPGLAATWLDPGRARLVPVGLRDLLELA